MTLNSTKVLLLVLLSTFTWGAYSQSDSTTYYNAHKKGKVFFSWGGNRANFTKSDITFRGDDYNFTINDVKAEDKPTG